MKREPAAGFTLIEVLVSTAVFSLVLVVAMSILGQATNIWKRSSSTVEAFQGARTGFDLITRTLSQATLNSYVDYVDSGGHFPSDTATYNNVPVRYARNSDLYFVVGPAGGKELGSGGKLPGTPFTGTAVFFQAPTGNTATPASFGGLDTMLNIIGYYVEFNSDSPPLNPAIKKWRYRLMQVMVPAESSKIFDDKKVTFSSWFESAGTGGYAYPVAENVIALIVRPFDPNPALAATAEPNDVYDYNSRLNATQDPQPIRANQMPPTLKVTMIAIDEASALHIDNGSAEPSVIAGALSGRFKDAQSFDGDMTAVEGALTSNHIDYRVFSSTVPIRESRWTK